jgi:hypothetical protein
MCRWTKRYSICKTLEEIINYAENTFKLSEKHKIFRAKLEKKKLILKESEHIIKKEK